MKYNLEVLNDKEFEDLCKNLLDIFYSVDFQIFKAGRDGGIDLLYSGTKENEIVVQCKHYINSGFGLLINRFKDKELTNINKMFPPPHKYVVATSLALSVAQTKEIKTVLMPYVRNTNDIFSRKRIENLLSKNADVEKRFFKLWLTSTSVLLNILHHASHYSSEFHSAKIISNTKIYVPTQNFNTATHKLSENKFLIISGAPGVGKTTLAFMLICERLAEGYDLVYCDGKIAEVEHALSDEASKKQIFFIDDFLGANLYDIRNPKNPENKLISFIQKFQASKNKYLVLTSRTTVLNQATHDYEHLKISGLTTLSQYELKLKQYSLLDKAKILYNHLYFSKVEEEFLTCFFDKEVYTCIIEHRNYFPRLVQFITDESKFSSSGFEKVKDFIFDKLEHPDIIWEYAFEKQLDDEDRFLLLCLFTLGGNNVPKHQLEIAFESRYKYEIKINNIRRIPKAFQHSLKKVLNGFVNASKNTDTDENFYSFFNPSIIDFLIYYLKGNDTEIVAILNSASYVEQLTKYFDTENSKKIKISPTIIPEILEGFVEISDMFNISENKSSTALKILDALHSFFEAELIMSQNIPIKWLKKISEDLSEVNSERLSNLIWRIGLLEEWPEVIEFIKLHFENLVCTILKNAMSEDDLDHFVELFKIYNFSINEFISNENNKILLQLKLGSIFSTMIRDIDFDSIDVMGDSEEYGGSTAENKIQDKVWDGYTEFVDRLSLGNFFDELNHEYELDASDIVHAIRENYIFDGDGDDFAPRLIGEREELEDPWIEIDRLFTK